LIASVIALPVVVILALAFAGGLSDKGPGKVAVSAPPTVAACAPLMAKMPQVLAGLASRTVTPDSDQVRAWGNPAVVLRCGVNRPTFLAPGSSDQQYYIQGTGSASQGVLWDQPSDSTPADKPVVFTAVDRDVYVEVTLPPGQSVVPMPNISDLILSVFPTAVCEGQTTGATPLVPDDQLCTYRK
jgi:hypothetical protein